MEGTLQWPSWLITLGWSLDLFMAIHLENRTQWQTSAFCQQSCGLCLQYEMKALSSNRKIEIDQVQSSGDCSLGLASMDLDLSKKRRHWCSFVRSGKMRVGTVFGFLPSSSRTNHSGIASPPSLFSRVVPFLGAISCASLTPYLVWTQPVAFPTIWCLGERSICTLLKWWSRTPVSLGLRKCFWASISEKETKGSTVVLPVMDMKMR